MGDFTFDKIAEETNLVNKYSEIFKSGKKESVDKFKDYCINCKEYFRIKFK